MPGTHRRHGRDSWYPSHMTIKPRVHSARSVVGEPTELSEGLKQQGEGRSELILNTQDLLVLYPGCCDTLAEMIRRIEDEGGCVVIVDPSLPIERTLRLLDLEHVAPVVPTLGEAVSLLEGHD